MVVKMTAYHDGIRFQPRVRQEFMLRRIREAVSAGIGVEYDYLIDEMAKYYDVSRPKIELDFMVLVGTQQVKLKKGMVYI